MARLLGPFLWVAGTLLLMASFLVPVLNRSLFIKQSRETAESRVEQVLRLEEKYFQVHQVYLPFPRGDVPEALSRFQGGKPEENPEFVVDAFMQGNEFLMIRATTSERSLKSGDLPLMIFVARKQLRSPTVIREWLIAP